LAAVSKWRPNVYAFLFSGEVCTVVEKGGKGHLQRNFVASRSLRNRETSASHAVKPRSCAPSCWHEITGAVRSQTGLQAGKSAARYAGRQTLRQRTSSSAAVAGVCCAGGAERTLSGAERTAIGLQRSHQFPPPSMYRQRTTLSLQQAPSPPLCGGPVCGSRHRHTHMHTKHTPHTPTHAQACIYAPTQRERERDRRTHITASCEQYWQSSRILQYSLDFLWKTMLWNRDHVVQREDQSVVWIMDHNRDFFIKSA
jgi:hypothetical protein